MSNLRIRSGQATDRLGIESRGTDSAPVYVVTGFITSANELLMPGGRFRAGDVARLAQWLDELARFGPPDQRPERSAFGLTPEQFEQVHQALAGRIGFSTKGMSRRQVIEKVRERLILPLRIEPRLIQAISEDDVVAEELSDLSCGTALAAALRPPGLALVPRDAKPRGLECLVAEAKPDMEAWPIGWEPEKPRRELLPGSFEFLNVNVQGVPVTQVIEAVSGRLSVPVLLDHNAMARHGIEPDKALVSMPQRRTTYSLLLKRCLYQAGLKSELRVDEAGKPFLWITTVKPI